MDTVFDCVVHYIHDASDKNSFSLVSRTCYDTDAKTREHVTAHLCYATPLSCRQRFPFIESLTLAGNPHIVDLASSPCKWDHNLIPWVQEIATSFKRLKVVRFQSLVVRDLDLELLARSRGEKLRVLEIDSCSGFSTDGLLYIGKDSLPDHGSTSSVGRKSNAIFALPGHGNTSSVARKSNVIFALPGHGSTSFVARKSNAIFALPGHESTSSVGSKSNAIFALPDHE
ncbi:coronatine-insensitive protein 1-like protein, partial [Tanacetum coccineum]